MYKTTSSRNSFSKRLGLSADPVLGVAVNWLRRHKPRKSGLLYGNEENDKKTDNYCQGAPAVRSISGKGMLLSLACCAFFSLQSLCVRLGQVDTVTSLIVRSVIQLTLCGPWTVLNSSGTTTVDLPWKRPSLLLIGVFSSLTVAAEYFSFRNLPLGDATVLLLGTAPVFTGVLAMLLIKEKWPLADIIAAVLSIAGVVCVARPTFIFGSLTTDMQETNETSEAWKVDTPDDDSSLRMFAIFTALAGALTTSFAFLAVRKAGNSVSYISVSIYSSVIAGVGSAIYLCVKRESLVVPCSKTQSRYLLVAIGVTGFMGQVTGTKAIQLQSASTVALVRYLDVPLSFSYEVLFFRHQLSAFSLVGATVIVIAATVAGLFKMRQDRQRRRHTISDEQKRRFV
ncbi:solute carrier family 35 member G1-like [Corticium candelabrum]|uniref:solute carrier family 35 member G1-like n=1 Tax=Corticium candelabrum TaxID=121492 RepID=UPI002E26F642|nr:solute carrier family 35 member G1-like [Corticium candelabrum]